jgi:tetratricopeptide (TPR) repeat protein
VAGRGVRLQGVAPSSLQQRLVHRWQRLDRSFRTAVWVCFVALLIHLVPLALPRNTAEQELEIARATPSAAGRVELLRPLREHPGASAAQLREAAALVLPASSGDARALVDEAARRGPPDVETQLLLAEVCEVEHAPRCVHEALERAQALAPGDARPHLLRADLAERDGDLDGAAAALAQAVARVPSDVAVALRYGRLLSDAGRSAEAERVLAGLEGRLPAPQWLVELGQVRARQGRHAEARALYQRALGEQPQLAPAHYLLGRSLYALGDPQGAERELREADRLDLGDPEALLALCAMQLSQGQRDAARISRMDLDRRFPEAAERTRAGCQPDGP